MVNPKEQFIGENKMRERLIAEVVKTKFNLLLYCPFFFFFFLI